MVVHQVKLAEILLYSFAIGMLLGVVYDYFRIRRRLFSFGSKKVFKHTELIENVLIFIEDVLYALICSGVVCIFLFYANSGRQRGIIFLGAVIGFVVYYYTIGKLVMLVAGYVVNFLLFLFRKIFSVTVLPLFRLLVWVMRLTVIALIMRFVSYFAVKLALKKAENGFGITNSRLLKFSKGKIKDEESFKHICESGGCRVHSVLHCHNNSDAV